MSYFAYFNYGKYQRPHRHSERCCEPSAPVKLRRTPSSQADHASMDESYTKPLRCMQVSASGVTDAGHRSKQNQDAFFTLSPGETDTLFLGVFDGHGRDTGLDAATTARAFFEAQFRSYTADQIAALEEDPHAVFMQLFHACHTLIKTVFRQMYEQRGYTVREDDGSLVRRDDDDDDEDDAVCIRGGTTATIVVILQGGSKIITANVGDSAALIGSDEAILGVNDVRPCVGFKTTKPSQARRFPDEIKNEYVLLTGNHSADNESEFLRVRKHSFGSPEAQVQFVYDCARVPSSRAARKCQPVFSVNHRGLVQHNPIGDYFKNVRDEWATMVTTPVEAPYPEALAFTRSLGDFNLHSYGVSEEPTVNVVHLQDLLTQQADRFRDEASQCTELFLVVASDGVWDNWRYEELVHFLVNKNSEQDAVEGLMGIFLPLSPQQQGACEANSDPADKLPIDRLASMLMDANIERAERIFGEQADNMTAIVCRLQFLAN